MTFIAVCCTSMSVRRGDALLDISTRTRTNVCDYPVLLGDDDALNAYADGNNIIITRGMMRFLESDRELALVIGHELAHNSMRAFAPSAPAASTPCWRSLLDTDGRALRRRWTSAGHVRHVSAPRCCSQDFEADERITSACTYMHWAGMELARRPISGGRMAATSTPLPSGEASVASHPSTPPSVSWNSRKRRGKSGAKPRRASRWRRKRRNAGRHGVAIFRPVQSGVFDA